MTYNPPNEMTDLRGSLPLVGQVWLSPFMCYQRLPGHEYGCSSSTDHESASPAQVNEHLQYTLACMQCRRISSPHRVLCRILQYVARKSSVRQRSARAA